MDTTDDQSTAGRADARPSSAVLTLDRHGHLFPGQAGSVADRLDEMAQAAGIVHRAEVVAIEGGRS